MTDPTRPDDPIDFAAVSATDALVERLRASLHAAEGPRDAVVWGDDDDDDADEPGYALLRALQRDVSADLPTPVASGHSVVALDSRRRGKRRVATVAAVTAGVLSLAGAAAASSSPGDALYGVRSAVASAVDSVLDAVTPSTPVGPKRDGVLAGPSATATAGIRGDQVSDQARSDNAVRQITERVATARRLIAQEKWAPALNVLAQAERSLAVVLPTDRGNFQRDIDLLQGTATAGLAADRNDDRGKKDDDGTRPDRSGTGKTSGSDDRSGSSGSGRDGAADTEARKDAPPARPTSVRSGSSGTSTDVDRTRSGLDGDRSDDDAR